MVKAKKVKLGVTGLLGFQHYLKLSPLLTHKVGRPLDDVVGFNCRGLERRKSEETNTDVLP